MKKRFFLLVAAFFAMMFVPFFQSSANAQSDKALADEFVNKLRTELMNDKTGSVNVVGKNVEIKVVSDVNKGEPTAEFACDLVDAAKKFITDNPFIVSNNEETMKYVRALSAVGVNFKLLFIDSNTNEKYSITLSPDEIAVFDILDEMDSVAMVMSIMPYMPIEKFVKHLNSMLEEAGMVFELEGNYVYFVVAAPGAAEFQEVNRIYMSDKAGFTEGFVSSFMEGAGAFADMIHKYNRKVGVKITCPGYSPIVINVD